MATVAEFQVWHFTKEKVDTMEAAFASAAVNSYCDIGL